MNETSSHAAFERWWNDEVMPKLMGGNADGLQEAFELCRVAWANGAYTQQRVDERIVRLKMKYTSYTCNIDQKPPKK